MKLVIPPQIKIGIHTYEIYFRPTMWTDEGLRGAVNHRMQTIELEPTLPPSVLLWVLIHEALHIIEEKGYIHIDESDISRFAEGLAELLVNNWGIEFDWSQIPTHT